MKRERDFLLNALTVNSHRLNSLKDTLQTKKLSDTENDCIRLQIGFLEQDCAVVRKELQNEHTR